MIIVSNIHNTKHASAPWLSQCLCLLGQGKTCNQFEVGSIQLNPINFQLPASRTGVKKSMVHVQTGHKLARLYSLALLKSVDLQNCELKGHETATAVLVKHTHAV
jgi:hypothetical protein